MALLIFCGHPPTSLKYALHHLSPEGIFLYLTSLSYIVSLLDCATSQLWNLNHIVSLLSGAVSHHVSKSWTISPSSSIWSWCCIISPPRACPCNVKVLAAFFLKLQGFVDISLHLQSLNESSLQCQSLGGILLETSRFRWHLRNLNEKSLHLQSLVGISEFLISSYSAMYPWCLSYIASEYWCHCSFIIKVHISATSMRVQVLMWSIVITSWQRWTLARLQCEWSVGMASWQRWMMTRLRYEWNVDVATWQRWMMTWLRCEWSIDMTSWQRWMMTRLRCEWNIDVAS